MASIVYSTADKITPLERINTEEDKYMEPNEFSARVRIAKIEFTADGAQSDPLIVGRFDGAVELLEIVLLTDDGGVADFDLGVTPQSAPVDTDQSLGAALALVQDVVLRPPLAVGYEITVPSYVVLNFQTGDLADTTTLKGYILYVDNS